MPLDGIPCEGPEDALVTVVEYVGYECPFTRRLEPTVRRLLQEHAGVVRFCVRQYVIPADQPHGLLAAHTALETFRQRGPEAFFRLHRALLDAESLDEALILRLALDQHVDEGELGRALSSDRHVPALMRDRELLHRLNRNGTPELFISGQLVAGARPYEDVAPVFERVLAEARRLLDAGVPRGELYQVVQRRALETIERPSARPGEPARVRIRFIDVATTDHPLSTEPRTLEEARALADRLAAEIRGGADFGEMARRWSAASNAERGGDFGWVTRGTLTRDVEDVAMALAVGDVGVTCEAHACRIVQRVE
ncbi:MAG: thioredoxin domain-containing protein [Myxococcales bacterium]|nr:thioredoxin domain-containing protein [Myxococcales bacterium]